MSKSFIFILFNLCSNAALASWQESYFRMFMGGEISSRQQADIYQTESIGFNSSVQKLMEGYGIRTSIELTSIDESLHDKAMVNANYSIGLDGIVFFAINSEAEIELSTAQIYLPVQDNLKLALQGTQSNFLRDIEEGFLRYSLGNDSDYFNINMSLHTQKTSKTSLTDGIRPEHRNIHSYSSQALWRQSEDTRWGGKLDITSYKTLLFENDVRYVAKNTYLSFITKYLGRNEIEINLGNSSMSKRSTFSWLIKNTTYVRDYSTLLLTSSRIYNNPINSDLHIELTTYNSVQLQIKPFNYLALDLVFENEYRESADIKTYKFWQALVETEVLYSDVWRTTFGLGKQVLSDLLANTQITQTHYGLKVVRQLF